MKVDLLAGKWLDIVFEGRNKGYGAYELRKDNSKTTTRAFLIGAAVFALMISIPLIADMLPESSNEDTTIDKKIVTVKLPPKKEIPKDLPPPPPPPPKVDQVKFVKPVVAKAEEVVEEPPKIKEIVDKKLGAETIKGDPDAPLTVEPVGNGPGDVIEEDNTIYNMAGIEVKAEFPGGVDKFRQFVANNYRVPEDLTRGGNVFVSFVVEKDGTMSDIKVVRDVGSGTGAEAIRVLKSIKTRWTPGEQNGKKVRMLFSMPIKVQVAE